MEQLNIFSYTLPQYKITKPIRLIELFAGIGSQAKALKNIGANFEHYRIVEFDKYAIASYNAIHGTNFEPLDITKITAKDLNIVNTDKYEYIMTYSFPCQDLSLAGKGSGMKKGSGTRSGLLWEVERLLKECNELPQVLLMENVPQVISKKNLKDFMEWELFLEKLGYSNYFELLNAKDYGIPQNRNRCFMISILGDYYYGFPRKQPLKLRLKDMLEDEVDEKYYLSEKMLAGFNKHNEKHIKKGTGFLFKPKNGEDIASCLRANAALAPTDNCIQVGNLDICGSSTSAGGGVVISDLRIRKLTPKECWRLMGFSDEDFEKASKVNSNAQLYKQAGNSIVVNVLEAIFKELL